MIFYQLYIFLSLYTVLGNLKTILLLLSIIIWIPNFYNISIIFWTKSYLVNIIVSNISPYFHYSTDDGVVTPKRLRIKMFVAALALLFIIRLRFPRGQPISDIITRRYGRPALLRFRVAERSYFKAKKAEKDLQFLEKCKAYDIIPKFLRFKVYNPNFRYSRTYREWQLKLLEKEISVQCRKIKKCNTEYERAHHDLGNILSYLDYKCLLSILKSNSDKKIIEVERSHVRKLRDLGISFSKCLDIERVIFNLSDRVLTEKEKKLLGLGLEFGLQPPRVNFYDHFLGFEKICNVIKNCNKYGDHSWNSIFRNISSIAHNSFRVYNRVVRDFASTDAFNLLKHLKQDPSLLITKPDKGRGGGNLI